MNKSTPIFGEEAVDTETGRTVWWDGCRWVYINPRHGAFEFPEVFGDRLAPPLKPQTRCERMPLSYAQRRLWFLNRLQGTSTEYNMPQAMRLTGELDSETLQRAINTIVERHESLRTSFAEINGEPVQVIEPRLVIAVPTEDISSMEESEQRERVGAALRFEWGKPFNLARAPLLRVKLLKLSARQHILLRTMHHIVSDGWSDALFIRELLILYEGYCEGRENPLEPLEIQYADFALWQRQWLEAGGLDEGLKYWKEQLKEMPVRLELPTDRPRPATQSYRGLRLNRSLSVELSEGLRRLSREEGATLFMLLLAVLQLLIARWSGQPDVAVGTPAANRSRPELEGVIGLFVNMLVLRTNVSGDLTFRQLLRRVRLICLAAYTHQDVPFERLVMELNPERDLTRNILFQATLNLLNLPIPSTGSTRLDIEVVEDPSEARSKFDLTVYAQDDAEISLILVFNSELFDRSRMVEFLDQFEGLLAQVVSSPDCLIDKYSLLTPQASMLLPNPAIKLQHNFEATILERFAETVSNSGSNLAITDSTAQYSYERVDEISSRIGCSLMGNGLRGSVVAVYARRSAALIHCLLAIWRAGAAFLVLDAQYPPMRLARYIEMVRPTAFLDASGDSVIPVEVERVLEAIPLLHRVQINGERVQVYGTEMCQPDTSNFSHLETDCPAYVTLTSGSTGDPKAIVGTHAPLSHFVKWYSSRFDLVSSDRFAMLSGLSHDPLLRDIFVPLSVGAAVCIPNAQIAAGDGLAEWLVHQNISVMHLTPSVGRLLEESAKNLILPELRCICFAGEPLTYQRFAAFHRLAPNASIVNFYGTTETPQAMSYWTENGASSEAMAGATVPLGKGIDDVQLLILNHMGRQCGISELGEIHVRTPYLTQGYHDDPRLTENKYVVNPFRDEAKDRIYKTGDLGRYAPDGDVEYCGRLDNQVKIRGFRVELGEIASALRSHEHVQDAVVVMREDQPGEKQLVAYVLTAVGQNVTPILLQKYVGLRLPNYMVPASVMVVEELPLTPNGKLDLNALPLPQYLSSNKYEPPSAPEEVALCEVFAEILGLDCVGMGDSFFELGGHSLMALRLMDRLKKRLGMVLPLRAIFEHPTVAQLVGYLKCNGVQSSDSSLVYINARGKHRPFFCVHPGRGLADCYFELSRFLGSEYPFYGLQSYGVQDGEAPLIRIEAMAERYLRSVRTIQPVGPYQLGGWCIGGTIAFEMARQLAAVGENTSLLAVFEEDPNSLRSSELADANLDHAEQALLDELIKDGLSQGNIFQKLPNIVTHQEGYTFSRMLEVVVRAYQEIGLIPPEMSIQQCRRLLRVWAANRISRANYCFKPFSGRITVFRSSFKHVENDISWDPLAQRGVEVRELPFGHSDFVNASENARRLAEVLRTYLDATPCS